MSLWQKIKLIFVTLFTRHFHQTYCKTCVADEDVFVYWADSEVFYDIIVTLLINVITFRNDDFSYKSY